MKSLLIKLKSKLPLNGDWLFVTETPVKVDNNQVDQATGYDNPNEVITRLQSNDTDTLKITYDRAKEFERSICQAADHIRDKAKTLLSTGTFVSAALFGVSTFFLTPMLDLHLGIVIILITLFILMVSHFLRALALSVYVMTREEYVQAAPLEFINLEHGKTIAVTLKEAIAQVIAYANQTSEYIRLRSNKLIIAQHAFRWGLFFFLLLFLTNFAANTVMKKENQNNYSAKIDGLLTSLLNRQHEYASRLDTMVQLVGKRDDLDICLMRELEALRFHIDSLEIDIRNLRQLVQSRTKGSINSNNPK
jgi:hypothetical protein